MTDFEKLRELLELAWWDGWGTSGTYDSDFNDWYVDNLDAIMDIGTESPASEKVSEKEKPGPIYYGSQYF